MKHAMADLVIEGIPADLMELIQQRAEANGRTVAEEVICLLRQALASSQPAARDLPPVVKGAFPLTDAWLDQAKRSGRS